jgi:hypothetical protein
MIDRTNWTSPQSARKPCGSQPIILLDSPRNLIFEQDEYWFNVLWLFADRVFVMGNLCRFMVECHQWCLTVHEQSRNFSSKSPYLSEQTLLHVRLR